jgi:hypothetical protein
MSILVSVPCLGESAHGSVDTLQSSTAAQQYDHCKLKPDDPSSVTDVTVYEIVSVNVWPSSTDTTTILQDSVVWKTLTIKWQLCCEAFVLNVLM